MNPQDIRAHVRREPFQPFRVHLANGSHYDVLHPELILVTQTDVVIARQLNEDDVPEKTVFCDPFHVTHVEHIEPPARRRRKADRKTAK